MPLSVSVCIASHNQGHLVSEAIWSAVNQYYPIELILMDDASTDDTEKKFNIKGNGIKYFKSEEPSGSGGAFNKAISHATGDIIVLLCADDIFTDRRVVSDIVNEFKKSCMIGHVSRYYYQFLDGHDYPVRAWRINDVIELANNPSGLAFRRDVLDMDSLELTNKMFVEAPTLVANVIKKWSYTVLQYDTVAVRIHESTARSPEYYKKRWVSSPVEEWVKIGGKSILNDFTSLIQIKNYGTNEAVWQEIKNFIKYKPINLIRFDFIFYAVVALLTPRIILRHVPHIYRVTLGRLFTRVRLRK